MKLFFEIIIFEKENNSYQNKAKIEFLEQKIKDVSIEIVKNKKNEDNINQKILKASEELKKKLNPYETDLYNNSEEHYKNEEKLKIEEEIEEKMKNISKKNFENSEEINFSHKITLMKKQQLKELNLFKSDIKNHIESIEELNKEKNNCVQNKEKLGIELMMAKFGRVETTIIKLNENVVNLRIENRDLQKKVEDLGKETKELQKLNSCLSLRRFLESIVKKEFQKNSKNVVFDKKYGKTYISYGNSLYNIFEPYKLNFKSETTNQNNNYYYRNNYSQSNNNYFFYNTQNSNSNKINTYLNKSYGDVCFELYSKLSDEIHQNCYDSEFIINFSEIIYIDSKIFNEEEKKFFEFLENVISNLYNEKIEFKEMN